MVVINGDKLKDGETTNEDTSVQKLKECSNSNFTMTDNTPANEKDKESGTDINLYDDLETSDQINSNGPNKMSIMENSITEDSKVASSNDELKLDNVLGKLLADTLIDESEEQEYDSRPINKNDAHIPSSNPEIAVTDELEQIQDKRTNNCNGNRSLGPDASEDEAIQEQHQLELSFAVDNQDPIAVKSQSDIDSEEDGTAAEEIEEEEKEEMEEEEEIEDEEVDYEEQDEDDENIPSSELDEDEYRALNQHHKDQQNKHKSRKNDEDDGDRDLGGEEEGAKDSSIMVIDSDDDDDDDNDHDNTNVPEDDEDEDSEEDCDDDEDDDDDDEDPMDGGELDEMEMGYVSRGQFENGLEGGQQREVTNDKVNNQFQYYEQHNNRSSSASNPVNLSAKNEAHTDPVKPGPRSSKLKRKNNEDYSDYKPISKNNSESYSVGEIQSSGHLITIGYKQDKGVKEDYNKTMGRDHSSIMKSVKFAQELDALKRKGISIGNSCSAGINKKTANNNNYSDDREVDDDEEEAWEALQQWNENREDDSEFIHNGNKSIDPNSNNSNNINSRNDGNNKYHSSAPLKHSNSEKTNAASLHNGPGNLCTSSSSSSDKKTPSTIKESTTINTTPTTCSSDRVVAPAAQPIIVPQLNESKGYFEIGRCLLDDPLVFMHTFSVTVIFAKGLSKVIPGVVLRSCREGPHFGYSLLGCPIHTDPMNDVMITQFPGETANGRLLATDASVQQYLKQNSTLLISLMIGELQIATATVDLAPLIGGSKRVVEGAYQLIPVEGNIVTAIAGSSKSNSSRSVVGVSVELTRLNKSEDADIELNDKSQISTEASNEENKTKDTLVIKGSGNESSKDITLPTRKRDRLDSASSSNDASFSRNDSLILSANRKQLKQDLAPPTKKRKLSLADESEQRVAGDTQSWQEAHEDFGKWRETQEKIFLKQWLIRETKLLDSLSMDWHARVESLEGELESRLEEVQEERAAMEEQARMLLEREQRCRQREEQLLQLQEDVLQQQTALGAQLRLQHDQHQEPVCPQKRLAILQSRGFENKQLFKSQLLRGVASTHRRWKLERNLDHQEAGSRNIYGTDITSNSDWMQRASPSTSRLPGNLSTPACGGGSSRFTKGNDSRYSTSPAGATIRSSPNASLSTNRYQSPSISHPQQQQQQQQQSYVGSGKYDTTMIDEIARLTKERRKLCSHPNSEEEVSALDKTIDRLLKASGV